MKEIYNRLDYVCGMIKNDSYTKNEIINVIGEIANLVNEEEMKFVKLEDEKLRQYKRISELEGKLSILYDLIKGAIDNL